MPSLLFEQDLRDAIAEGQPRMSENQIETLKGVCEAVPDPPWVRKTTSRRELAYYKDERGIGWVQHLTVFLDISGGIPVAYRTLEELRARLREQGFSHLQRREECILSGGHLDIREPIPVDELTLEDVDWPESDEFRYLLGMRSPVR